MNDAIAGKKVYVNNSSQNKFMDVGEVSLFLSCQDASTKLCSMIYHLSGQVIWSDLRQNVQIDFWGKKAYVSMCREAKNAIVFRVFSIFVS